MRNETESIYQALKGLRGNQRACLFTEPLWGIPYNLYLPFVSVFMAALGMSPIEIELIDTVFLASQMCWALICGVLTDKMGRRKATVIFDIVSWSIPSLLWMCAQDFRWFLVAALFNGAWRVTETSWGLLLVEDAPDDKLVSLFSITHIAGLIAGFVAPVAYVFVQRYGVVPTMRVLYFITFVMMTTKFILLYFITKETSVGKRRIAQTKDVSIPRQLWDSRHVLANMLRSKRTMYTVALIACFQGMRSVGNIFWPLLVTSRLGIATENLSIFATVKSLLMLFCYLVIVPELNIHAFKRPLLLAFSLMLFQQLLMLAMPANAYALVILSVLLEAVAMSVISPVTSSLQMLNIDREERARMLGLFYAMSMLVTAPLGTIGGLLADINAVLPFALNIALTLGAIALSVLIWRESRKDPATFVE